MHLGMFSGGKGLRVGGMAFARAELKCVFQTIPFIFIVYGCVEVLVGEWVC